MSWAANDPKSGQKQVKVGKTVGKRPAGSASAVNIVHETRERPPAVGDRAKNFDARRSGLDSYPQPFAILESVNVSDPMLRRRVLCPAELRRQILALDII